MGKTWRFSRTAGGQWEWFYDDPATGAPIKRSARVFTTLRECVTDASRNGYAPPGSGHPIEPTTPTSGKGAR